VKEFVIYTGLRIVLFALALLVVLGIWFGISGSDRISIGTMIWPILIAMVISGLASYPLLSKQRNAFAQVVERRAAKAAAAFEQLKAKEDDD
jgi:hypothetical protein